MTEVVWPVSTAVLEINDVTCHPDSRCPLAPGSDSGNVDSRGQQMQIALDLYLSSHIKSPHLISSTQLKCCMPTHFFFVFTPSFALLTSTSSPLFFF